jgi:hypothetical protein
MSTNNANELKETKKVIKSDVGFKKLSDLTADDVKNLKTYAAKLYKRESKNFTNFSIVVKIHPAVKAELTSSRKFNSISEDKFNRILIEKDLDFMNEYGHELDEWNLPVKVRFVKGIRAEDGSEYRSLEIIFKQYVYVTYFFTDQQTANIDSLEKQNRLPGIEWVTRPDKISGTKFEFGDDE